MVALVVAAAVLLVVLLAVGIVLVVGRNPQSRLHPWRASATEAGERSSDLAAEFFDWLRFGR